MPKKMFVDPEEVRKPGKLSFTDIPMNVYQKPLEQELSEGAFTPEELKTIYHDMYMIRTFEEMLHTIKVLGMYRQHKFSYTGPAHLSIGEEAYAVGEAFLLDENDFIFGSHRGHHEVLAKAMSAIRKDRAGKAAGKGLSGTLPEIPGIAPAGSAYPNRKGGRTDASRVFVGSFYRYRRAGGVSAVQGCGPCAAKRKESGAWTT
mgnify:CR=1 FL=1